MKCEDEAQKQVTVELCRSNSLGSNFHAPSVIEQIACCTQEEAEEYLKKKMANNFFYRIASN